MSETTLDVPFKGQRTYLQSANLWHAISPLLLRSDRSSEARLSVSFRRLLDRLPILIFPALDRPAPGVAVGDVVLTDEGRRELGYLREGDRPVGRRIADYEDGMRGDVQIDGTVARYVGSPAGMTSVEVIVAATKFLHQESVSAKVKWLATRLELPLRFDLTAQSTLEIRISHKTATLATMSDVIVDGSWCGKVAFNPMPVAPP